MATSSRSRRDSASSVRLGVISFAHGHVNAYVAIGPQARSDFLDTHVVTAWDDDRERGVAQCQKYGLAFEEDLDALLRRDDLDAVFVTSPTNQHAAHAVAAAQGGKHVLLQKPMALTLQDCDAIIAAVRRYGVKFSMCYQMRADPVNRKIKELLDEGAVGHVAVVRRRHAIGALLSPSFARPGNWHIDPVQNMGMFMDDASHAADWFYWMLGRPISVIAEIDNVVTNVAPDDNGVAVYRFLNKEMGILLNSSTMLAAEATTEIYGDAGTIVQNYGDGPSSALPRPPGASALKIYRAEADDWGRFDFPADVPHGARIRALCPSGTARPTPQLRCGSSSGAVRRMVPRPLIDYLQGRAGPLATAEDGRVCIEMILGAYRAVREGRRVHFPLQD